jgi:signal transduction histidine kinase
MENEILYLIVSVIQMFVFIIYLKEFLGYKHSVYWMMACWLVLEAVNTIVTSNTTSYVLNTLIYLFMLFATAFIMCNGSWKQKILFIFVYHGIITLLESLLISVVMLIGTYTATTILENTYIKSFLLILTQIIGLVLIQIVYYFWKRKATTKIEFRNWLGTILVSISCLAAMLFLATDMMHDSHTSVSQTMVFLFLVCMEFLNYYFYRVSVELNRAETEKRVYQNQISMYEKQYTGNRHMRQEIRSFQHDMQNHLNALSGICHNGTIIKTSADRLEEIEKYLNKIAGIGTDAGYTVDSGNLILDSVIDMKKSYAATKNISMEEVLFIPEAMDYDGMDMVVLLGNLLDNAIEACDRLDENQQRKIVVEIQYRMENLILLVKNSYNGNRDGQCGVFTDENMWHTSKTDSTEHGIGMQNMVKIVNKYNGTMEWNAENKMITIDVLLYAFARRAK